MEKRHISPTQTGMIIVVDDDAAVCKSLKFALEVEGFNVRTYPSGEALLNEPAFLACCCFVIDQRLPGIDGVDLVAKLRDRKVTVPAILITTHPSATVRKRADSAGVPIVEKPLLGSALLDGIRQAMTQLTPPN
jgi:two-component system response regulator FixJ